MVTNKRMLQSIVEYVRKLEYLQASHLTPPSFPDGETEENIGSNTADKRLVLIYHDESSFHANEGQSWQWAEENMLVLCPKSQGRGLMVIDFIDKHSGFLRLSSKEQQLAKLSHPTLSVAARVIFKLVLREMVTGIQIILLPKLKKL